MKNTLLLTAAMMMLTVAPTFAQGCNGACLIAKLPNGDIRRAIREVDNEDQRVVDGSFNAATGTLTLYTQDMVAGADKDIHRRAVTNTGFEAMKGETGAPGQNGTNADTSAINAQLARIRNQASADRAVGSLQTRTPIKGQWTGALGLSGTGNGVDGVSGGVRYGLSDRADLYAVVGQSFNGQTSWGVGATFVFGGR